MDDTKTIVLMLICCDDNEVALKGAEFGDRDYLKNHSRLDIAVETVAHVPIVRSKKVIT